MVDPDNRFWLLRADLKALLAEVAAGAVPALLQHRYVLQRDTSGREAAGIAQTRELLFENQGDSAAVWIAGTVVTIYRSRESEMQRLERALQRSDLVAAVLPQKLWHHTVRTPFPLWPPAPILRHWSPEPQPEPTRPEPDWAWVVRLAWLVRQLHNQLVLVELVHPDAELTSELKP